ncbi:hypothetical protein KUTeg_001043 [Tegillarca granosa]|uniref:Uncharacterized protein n=1 Tax=Tegillarca granosa TaxID=220873 RepID=A0ABQ9FXE9_TEGGR|nr:hypothetical protein KUTeg_001043 [Tegillarca granosa]
MINISFLDFKIWGVELNYMYRYLIFDDHFTIIIRTSKTDQYRNGNEVVISRGVTSACPLNMLIRYMHLSAVVGKLVSLKTRCLYQCIVARASWNAQLSVRPLNEIGMDLIEKSDHECVLFCDASSFGYCGHLSMSDEAFHDGTEKSGVTDNDLGKRMCKYMLSSKSDSTWKQFCSEKSFVYLQASSIHVAIYLTNLLDQNCSHIISSTIYSIKWAHDVNGLLDPTDNAFVKNLLESAKHISLFDDHFTIIIRTSKTDQYRNGNEVVISRGVTSACPLNMLIRYMNLSGSVCKLVYKDTKISHTRVWESILSKLKLVAPELNLGVHSLQSGGATTAPN